MCGGRRAHPQALSPRVKSVASLADASHARIGPTGVVQIVSAPSSRNAVAGKQAVPVETKINQHLSPAPGIPGPSGDQEGSLRERHHH